VKASEVHNLKDDELVDRIRQTREEQFNLRLQHATGELENTARITAVRRDVARLLTVAKERGIDLERELRVP
jgi:large subunit ribosomal protein L29